jgi:hypothetical protein
MAQFDARKRAFALCRGRIGHGLWIGAAQGNYNLHGYNADPGFMWLNEIFT